MHRVSHRIMELVCERPIFELEDLMTTADERHLDAVRRVPMAVIVALENHDVPSESAYACLFITIGI